jgi:hypothetical protein
MQRKKGEDEKPVKVGKSVDGGKKVKVETEESQEAEQSDMDEDSGEEYDTDPLEDKPRAKGRKRKAEDRE